ncbi:histidine kinase [Niabella sp.]|uniref:sensor histidine kinase n=1 Tax=Niabella sp. TaxID=1962976 RepID=UPI0026096F21|nr:histidine kinase [Niabella sp.]
MNGTTIWIGVIVAIFVIALLIGIIITVILLARKQKLSQLLKEAQLQARINDVNFAALSSQMNPHFIFNCLNSIKLYTEQNNSEAAGAYLGMFARLIRITLHNARREKVPLSEEIDTLALYLQLEAMRFKEKLSYELQVDDNVDSEFIEIPPMLVQPYIENAIWHGLMHKKEGGTISIRFSQDHAQETLVISIHDNGIGRQKAAELKSKPAETYKSYGTQITGERMALIKEKYGIAAQVTTTDLYENDQPAGTLVILKLPLNEHSINSHTGR